MVLRRKWGWGELGEGKLGRAAYLCSRQDNLHVHQCFCSNERLTDSYKLSLMCVLLTCWCFDWCCYQGTAVFPQDQGIPIGRGKEEEAFAAHPLCRVY